ncbi:MAG: ROK family glucokinase [Elusimicrobia bacterium]|nr:ROK family glucokinase [Elusimicrobiota bacterium]
MSKYCIGVDLGGTNITIALIDLKGKIKNKVKISTQAGKNAGFVIKTIIENIRVLIRDVRFSQLVGIGIGAAGQIDQARGVIQFSPNLHWRNVPIVKEIKQEFNLPVYLDNDANVACYGEFLFGAGRGAQNILCITLGTGVGGGIIINNKIYRGAGGAAGEIGHITVESKGRKCNCGNRGCMEAYVGAPHIRERCIEKIKAGRKSIITRIVEGSLLKITPKVLEEAVFYKDKLAQEIWQETGMYLGVGLASLINIFNPEKIIIGGGIANAGTLISVPLLKTIKERALAVSLQDVKIVRAKLGEEAGVIGAAMLVLSA